VSKLKANQALLDSNDRRSLFSARFIAALVLFLAGLAWIAYYYVVVRISPDTGAGAKAGGPAFMADLKKWNYLLGFGVALLGLMVSSHPSTPLGRGRGVVVGMLGCFLLGLLWICTYYVFSNDLSGIPLMNDLANWNLAVGIGLMAVGFTFATRWE
jgi:Cell division protein CrgA